MQGNIQVVFSAIEHSLDCSINVEVVVENSASLHHPFPSFSKNRTILDVGMVKDM